MESSAFSTALWSDRRHRLPQRRPGWCAAGSASPLPEAPSEQHSYEDGVNERKANVRFHEPIVMNNAADGREIDKPVQKLPALATQSANPTASRSHGQGNQHKECGHTYGDVAALY